MKASITTAAAVGRVEFHGKAVAGMIEGLHAGLDCMNDEHAAEMRKAAERLQESFRDLYRLVKSVHVSVESERLRAQLAELDGAA